MPALNKTQINHACRRIEEARRKYVAKHIEALPELPRTVEMTYAEKITMIRTGKATLKEDKNLHSRYSDITDAFIYSLSDEALYFEQELEKHNAAVAKIKTAADAIEQQLIDELIMSPDGTAALARIATAFS
jgi:hypothetical protein